MIIQELLNKPLPEVPNEIADALLKSKISKTPFECKNDILSDEKLQTEVGFAKMEDGSYLVSMVCPMPDITAEMIEWWFWWHPQDSLRYKAWYPGDHISVGYHRKDKAYFQNSSLPSFLPNTQYPTERIGGVPMPLRIDFTTPEDFGFSAEVMKQNSIAKIVCGHVGIFNNLVSHTEMAHIFKETDDGLFMISRFWLGKRMKNSLLRKIIFNNSMAKGMAEHCCVEYRNLREILPALYYEYFADSKK